MDFSEKQYVDPTQIAQLAQQQQAKQAQLDQQGYQDKMQAVQQIAQSVSQMVSSSVEASKRRQKDDMVKNLADSMANRVPNVMAPQQGPVQSTMTPQGDVSQRSSLFPNAAGQVASQDAGAPLPPVSTPDYAGQNMIKASVKQDPTIWSKLSAEMMMQTPEQQAQTAMNTQKAAQEQATAAKLNQGILPSTAATLKAAHAKVGFPIPSDEDLKNMKEADAQTLIANAAKFNSQTGEAGMLRAENMKQNTIAKLHAGFINDMDPANWHGTSPAAISAKLVNNADNAISLADQMLQGKIPITSQTMTSLALDANRVISQSPVSSEKITEELKTKTGFSSVAAAVQYFTNHPQDQGLQPFVNILKTELVRQRTNRQETIDTALQKNLAKYRQLRQLDPEGWEAQVDNAGFDVESAKKGKLKLKDGVNSTMNGGNIGDTSGGFKSSGGVSAQNDPLGIR